MKSRKKLRGMEQRKHLFEVIEGVRAATRKWQESANLWKSQCER